MTSRRRRLIALVLLSFAVPVVAATDVTLLDLDRADAGLPARVGAVGWTDGNAGTAKGRGVAWHLGPAPGRINLTPLFAPLGTEQWHRATRLVATVRIDGLEPGSAVHLRLRINGEKWFHFTAESFPHSGRSEHVGFDLTTMPTRMGTGAVREVLLELPDATRTGYTLRIEDLRLSGASEADRAGRAIVDRYGQYAPGRWPEKIAVDADLRRQDAGERQWLARHPRPGGTDRFGGDTGGAAYRATGFFRLDRDGAGRSWLITPEGNRFFSYGIDAVSLWKYTDVAHRRAAFQWLPEDGGEFAEAMEGTHLRMHVANLRRKYGGSWRQAWLQRTNQRLWAWGMNTWGAWVDGGVTQSHQAPYTVCLPLQWQKEWGALPRVTDLIPDPFDPALDRYLRDALPSHIRSVRDDPWLIGYFLGNELKWYQLDSRRILALPATSAAKQALRASLQKKYPTPQAWATAWGIEGQAWSALDGLTLAEDARPSPAMAEDLKRFREELADRFFAVFCGAVRTLDPNHLILGTRFLHFPEAEQAPDEVYAACGRRCDAISENAYTLRPDAGYFARRSALAGKPVLITEFHFGVRDDPRQLSWGVRWVGSRQERARALEAYVESVARMPAVVGCHWFEYSDEPLLGRQDGENYQIGFVDVADTPYLELVEASRRAGERVYQWRTGTPATQNGRR